MELAPTTQELLADVFGPTCDFIQTPRPALAPTKRGPRKPKPPSIDPEASNQMKRAHISALWAYRQMMPTNAIDHTTVIRAHNLALDKYRRVMTKTIKLMVRGQITMSRMAAEGHVNRQSLSGMLEAPMGKDASRRNITARKAALSEDEALNAHFAKQCKQVNQPGQTEPTSECPSTKGTP